MLCQKCSKAIPDDSDFCPLCGERIITDTNPTPNKKTKKKFCKKCGGEIDSSIKKCSSCGKQYFKISKSFVAILFLVLIVVVLISLNIYQYTNSIQTKTEYEKTIQEQSDRIDSKDARISSLEDKNLELIKEKYENSSALNFYETYAVIVPSNGTKKYHKYGCEDLDDSSFRIYNIAAAENQGYYACSKCCE